MFDGKLTVSDYWNISYDILPVSCLTKICFCGLLLLTAAIVCSCQSNTAQSKLSYIPIICTMCRYTLVKLKLNNQHVTKLRSKLTPLKKRLGMKSGSWKQSALIFSYRSNSFIYLLYLQVNASFAYIFRLIVKAYWFNCQYEVTYLVKHNKNTKDWWKRPLANNAIYTVHFIAYYYFTPKA